MVNKMVNELLNELLNRLVTKPMHKLVIEPMHKLANPGGGGRADLFDRHPARVQGSDLAEVLQVAAECPRFASAYRFRWANVQVRFCLPRRGLGGLGE